MKIVYQNVDGPQWAIVETQTGAIVARFRTYETARAMVIDWGFTYGCPESVATRLCEHVGATTSTGESEAPPKAKRLAITKRDYELQILQETIDELRAILGLREITHDAHPDDRHHHHLHLRHDRGDDSES